MNVDGYKIVSETWGEDNWDAYKSISKNRKDTGGNCSFVDVGVNLNRNYKYNFGKSAKGSSQDPCSKIYRGAKPFSEEETQSVQKLLTNFDDVVSAINFFSNGGFLAYPSFIKSKKDRIEGLDFMKDAYEEFEQHCPKDGGLK